jgi:hypothetical protein
MKAQTVHLGFEVGSADPVEIPVRHMAVTGQTQESGKTTTLEALITRSGLPAIAFLTKRGEGSMHGREMLPYFEDRADWRFVQSILESTMHEKMKFERAWIVRACQGARTLAGVQANLIKLEENARNALSKDVYMLLGEYLRRVVPMIEKLPKGGERQMQYLFGEVHNGPAPGLSVMDLTAYPLELQMLVISSTLDWIHRHANGVISIIPEAWKFIPQGRNTPVRTAVENLMREGAVLKNYVWIDSQDLGAVDKALLRGVPVCLIGVQREANEIKRTLANMPEGLKKPKAGELATLELGQFFACFGKSNLKTYVQPAWMDETTGKRIAAGRLDVHSFVPPHTPTPRKPEQSGTGGVVPAGSPATTLDSPVLRTSAIEEEEMPINQEAVTALRLAIKDGAKETALRLLDGITGGNASVEVNPLPPVAFAPAANGNEPSEERLVQLVVAQLRRDPVLIRLSQESPAIEVKINHTKVSMDDSTIKGRIALLIHCKYFEQPRSFNDVKKTLVQRGLSPDTPNVRISAALADFVQMGFFWRTEENNFQLAPGAGSRVVAA